MSTQPAQRKSRATTLSLSTTTTAEPASSTSSTPTLSITERLHRLIDRDHEWDKSDLLDNIYWLRQVLAVAMGVLFGLFGVTGSVGMIVFVGVLLVGVFGWYGKYLQVDVEEMGSWQLMSEGSWTAFALFILLWTAFYSLDK